MYSISALIQPQYVANAAAALTLFPPSATTVPLSYAYQIQVMHVANKTAGPVAFTCWRVPSGQSHGDSNIVVPQFNIPSAAFPGQTQFDLTALWGAVLMPGDAIWALAGGASELIVQADGLVIQL